MRGSKAQNLVKELIGMGIFKPDKKVLADVFMEMGDSKTADFLTSMSDHDFKTIRNSSYAGKSSVIKANLIVMYAGPGAGKSTVTNYLFDRIPLKWLAVYTTRDIRVSENESVGNPFAKYNMSWDEFDSFSDNDSSYIKTVSFDLSGDRTKGYIVDLNESRNLLRQGYNLIIHSWLWDEFIQRSTVFDNTLTICLYVDYKATVKRLAYRNMVEACEKNLLRPGAANSLPSGPGETDVDKSLEILSSLNDKSIYEDLLIRIESAGETGKRYESVLKPENISCFKYVIDNSGNPLKAMKDTEAVVIADRYSRIEKKENSFTGFFNRIISHAEGLRSQAWVRK